MCPQTVLDGGDPVRGDVFSLEEGCDFVGCPFVVVFDPSDPFEWPTDIVEPRCCRQYVSVNALGMLVRKPEGEVTHSFRVEYVVSGERILIVRKR